MTENEAKTKWCPFVRFHPIDTVQISEANRPDELLSNGQNVCMCIASACMAWRVTHQWYDNAQQNPEWVSYAPYAFEPGEGQERDDGHCGLAGQP